MDKPATEDLEEALPKRAIGIRDITNPEKRDQDGRLILKAVQVNDPETDAEDGGEAFRTIRSGDCCMITFPVDEDSGLTDSATQLPDTHAAIIQGVYVSKGADEIVVDVRWLYHRSELPANILKKQKFDSQEVFYSMHDDSDIPALFISHPVKIWFLRTDAIRKKLLPRMHVVQGDFPHWRKRPGYLCVRSWDHESERMQSYPLDSLGGRQGHLNFAMGAMVKKTRMALKELDAKTA